MTNNEAEYEALLARLRISQAMEITSLAIFVDSQLLVNQIKVTYAAKQPTIREYLQKTKEALKGFDSYTIEHIRRNQNKKVNALSKLASMTFEHLTKEVMVKVLSNRSIEDKEILQVETKEGESLMTPIHKYLVSGILLKEPKESRKIRTDDIIKEVHKGSCGFNTEPRSMVVRITKQGYYWSSMHRDAAKILQDCEKCTSIQVDQRKPVPKILLHPMVSLYAAKILQDYEKCKEQSAIRKVAESSAMTARSGWPFSHWGVNILGPFPIAPRGFKFLEIAVEHSMKWVEAKPLTVINGRHAERFVWEYYGNPPRKGLHTSREVFDETKAKVWRSQNPRSPSLPRLSFQDARLSKFEADFKQQQIEMTNKIGTLLKAINDRMKGVLPGDTVKNSKLNVNPSSLVSFARSYPMEDPQNKYVESLELGKNESAFVQGEMPQKMKDPELFTLPCRLGDSKPFDTLPDLRSCVNLIPFYLFKTLNIRILKETKNVLRLADETRSYSIGIVKNIEVYVGKLKLLEDFYIIDMEKDPTSPLRVGRGFLETASAVIDCRKTKIAVGEGVTILIFRVKEIGLGARPPYYLEKEFMNDHLPGELEIARDAELNPFKDVLVFRKMVEFLGTIPINLKGNMWESEDMIETKIDWKRPPKEEMVHGILGLK
ncbi:reverse transcriptase domain-containing protein [Tanacetum coccineum]